MEQKTLHFVGKGAAFYPPYGNTSAWFMEDGLFHLIDCGESVFPKIWNNPEMLKSDKVVVLLTHLHCDHCGSLGSLISYCSITLKKKTTIFYPSGRLETFLSCVGIDPSYYEHIRNAEAFSYLGLEVYPSVHAPDMDCYSYMFNLGGKRIYFSGDSHVFPDEVALGLKMGKVDMVFHDTCMRKNPHHCPLSQLEQKIAIKNRSKVWCMHLDGDYTKKIMDAGFNVVEVEDGQD